MIEAPVPEAALRLSCTHVMHLAHPPSAVFPLLCPVREREWLEGWDARMLHSVSGLAEPGAVFTSPGPDGSEWVWTVSRHEPPAAVQFVVYAPGSLVTVLDIALEAETGGSRVSWTYTLTALDPTREGFHREYLAALPARLAALEAKLAHFLRTGACLVGAP
ncbi:hypothetical protein [Geothrix sp. 21YS21S-4]|uniref:hypothetical protein n=1 Tax=Geothrix sp. 21YS21S-4 TaxID=3068889 RepID=UPI0027B89705|nr:hypothetical protein [Geothrix sp. 21YS21S-4]